MLAPGGRLAVVDFAPHQLETLRDEHAHRRLGFSHDEVTAWFESAGLVPAKPIELAGDPLTVTIWAADAPAQPASERNAA